MEHEGEEARLNTFPSEEQEVGDPLCQGLILGALKECAEGLFPKLKFGKDFTIQPSRG
jgi:hypothetical protein